MKTLQQDLAQKQKSKMRQALEQLRMSQTKENQVTNQAENWHGYNKI